MSESDEWLREHKGDYIRTVGYIWECGDDYCNCTQAVVISQYRNKVVPRAVVPVGEWQGEFYTDGEAGADRDLAVYRRQLKEADPEREASITWQEGVDYDLDIGADAQG